MSSPVVLILLALAYHGPVASLADSTYRLPIRVHLVHSDQSLALATSRTARDVALLLATANRVWQTAGIEWTLASIRVDTAFLVPAYDSIIHGERPSVWPLLVARSHDWTCFKPAGTSFLSRMAAVFSGASFARNSKVSS
jgi:hypothetical protein